MGTSCFGSGSGLVDVGKGGQGYCGTWPVCKICRAKGFPSKGLSMYGYKRGFVYWGCTGPTGNSGGTANPPNPNENSPGSVGSLGRGFLVGLPLGWSWGVLSSESTRFNGEGEELLYMTVDIKKITNKGNL